MPLNTSRLDKFIASHLNISRKSTKSILAHKRVIVDGTLACNAEQRINRFSVIQLDGEYIQHNTPVYIMLHKPVGVVSATKDEQHSTVINLLSLENKEELHIAGRLDLNTSGLVLLTNDSRWSEALSSPAAKVEKCYQVTLKHQLSEAYISAFKQGFYFEYEDITTLPATLQIMSDYQAEVKIMEGKYHQIKRMFGRFRNPVIALHRSAIGDIVLDDNLSPGEYRHLTSSEVNTVNFR